MHGIITIKTLNERSAEAERIMAKHGHTNPEAAKQAHVDADPHSGVQAWSKGALFPGVITVVESHTAEGHLVGRTYSAQYKNRAQKGFATRELAEAWVIGRKAEDAQRRAATENAIAA